MPGVKKKKKKKRTKVFFLFVNQTYWDFANSFVCLCVCVVFSFVQKMSLCSFSICFQFPKQENKFFCFFLFIYNFISPNVQLCARFLIVQLYNNDKNLACSDSQSCNHLLFPGRAGFKQSFWKIPKSSHRLM